MAILIRIITVYIIEIILMLFVITSSCQNPNNQQNSIHKATSSPFELSSRHLQNLTKDIDSGIFSKTHAVIVYKDQNLIYEKYINGFKSNQKQYTASVSKSVGNILIGIAMQQGILEDADSGILDQPVYKLFPKYKNLLINDSLKRKILFRNILSMTGGLQWDESTYSYNDSRNDWISASNSNDPLKFLFNKPMAEKPGTTFNYNGGYSIMLSYLIQKKTNQSALKFAEENLFNPLNIKEFEWESIRNGLTDTDGGLHLLPKDMAKLGLLYLNMGKWNGKQIVSKKWIEESTKEQIISNGMPNYGFQWWCGNFNYKDTKAYTFFASGSGGQKIYVFPSFNSVIVISHQVFDNNIGELNNIKILSNYLLPALDKYEDTHNNYSIDPDERINYIGEYMNENDSFSIVLENDTLYIIDPDQPKLKLIPLGYNKFKLRYPQGVDFYLTFHTDETLKINSVKATIAFREIVYQKTI